MNAPPLQEVGGFTIVTPHVIYSLEDYIHVRTVVYSLVEIWHSLPENPAVAVAFGSLAKEK